MSMTLDNRIPVISAGSEEKASQLLRKAALDILADSHPRVPVSPSTPAGPRGGKAHTGGHLKSSGFVTETGPLQVEVGYDADYALWVEIGHHAHGTGTWVPPQPFLRPAFDTVVPAMLEAFKGLISI